MLPAQTVLAGRSGCEGVREREDLLGCPSGLPLAWAHDGVRGWVACGAGVLVLTHRVSEWVRLGCGRAGLGGSYHLHGRRGGVWLGALSDVAA